MEKSEEKLGIVVVNYRTPVNLSMCLLSIETYVDKYELVIIDNGEDRESREVIIKFKLDKKAYCEKNIGFCRAVNKGVEQLKTKYFGIVPADCMVTQSWKEAMLVMIEKIPKAGIMGAMCTQTSGPQGIEARGMITEPLRSQRIVLNGAVMEREVFRKMGGLDEKFPNMGGSFCDDDISRRYTIEGYKNWIIPVLIFHNRSASYQGNVSAFKEDMEKGREYFTHKWFKK